MNSSLEERAVARMDSEPVGLPAHLLGVAEQRVRTAGQRLVIGDSTYTVRGVTYGSFLPRDDGALFPDARRIQDS